MLAIVNRQRVRRIDSRLLRRVFHWVLLEQLGRPHFELNFILVNERQMTRLNEHHLGHAGSTDVITFDYTLPGESNRVLADIFICVSEAMIQARRYRTTWRQEIIRYGIHGLLHLCGYDDRRPAARVRMKRMENRLLRRAATLFRLGKG